jgi:Protein of unknown function (DUF3153)
VLEWQGFATIGYLLIRSLAQSLGTSITIEENNMKMIVGADKVGRSIEWGKRLLDRQLTIVLLTLAIALSGCVKYDTGVNFSSLNYGEIVEHIQLGEQLNSFSQNAIQTWVASIERRTKQAQGQLKHVSDREFEVIIPFDNARDLVTKIDRYFNPESVNTESPSQFNARMQIEQSNFLLTVRNHLIFDIDLRNLAIQTSDPKVSVAAPDFVDLDFSLQSPWGIANGGTTNIAAVKMPNHNQMTWRLKPGLLNHIDAIFWLPNPLGIGAIFIVVICLGGYYLKYRQLPWQLKSPTVEI